MNKIQLTRGKSTIVDEQDYAELNRFKWYFLKIGYAARTGNITFPRPEAPLLLQIRRGELDYKVVAPIIEEGLLRIENAQAKSTLPDKPDYKLAEDIIYFYHREEVYDHLVSYAV